MKNLTYLIAAMLLCTVSLFLLPWYFVLIICFILGIIRGNKKYRNAFLQGFLAVFLTYSVLYLFRDIPNEHMLSNEVAGIFLLPDGYVLLGAGALIFGRLAGFSWWSGAALRRLL